MSYLVAVSWKQLICKRLEKILYWWDIRGESAWYTLIFCSAFGGVKWNEGTMTEDVSAGHAVNI